MRAAALLLVLGTLCFAAGPAFPRAVMVPDQVATIQGAIDTLSDGSHGPDTVLVRYGEYPEALFVAEVPGSEHTLVLLPFESVAPTMFGPRLRMPQIRSFQTSPRAQRINCTIQGFHFMGPIAYNDAIECTTLFEACRMDSSLQISGTDVFAHVRGCQIWNGARVQAHSIEFIGNTVIGGGLSCHDVGYAEISDNYIVGPADAGITELSTASSIGIEHNTVVGTTEGIVNACATVSDNLVMGCSGNAFHYYRCDWPTHSTLGHADGILVPCGFGKRGIQGMVYAIQYARTQKIPFFGICLGMQCATIEYARDVSKLAGADSTEFDPQTPHRVIYKLRELLGVDEMGGTMRLGAWPCKIEKDSTAYKAYGTTDISERHRHRYEFNCEYEKTLTGAGFRITGRSPDGKYVEIVEAPEHPWFLGCQFHPEFKSKPLAPHPLFHAFVGAALAHQQSGSGTTGGKTNAVSMAAKPSPSN